MTSHAPHHARVIPLRPAPAAPDSASREPLWRHVVGGALRRERLGQQRTLKDVADAARISVPYLSELERGRKEASSEVLAAAAHALGLGLADLLALAHADLTGYTRARQAGSGGVAGPVTPRRGTGAECAVATGEDEIRVSSVAELSARPSSGVPVASRLGDVRLAA